jgi:hypothetical protein
MLKNLFDKGARQLGLSYCGRKDNVFIQREFVNYASAVIERIILVLM